MKKYNLEKRLRLRIIKLHADIPKWYDLRNSALRENNEKDYYEYDQLIKKGEKELNDIHDSL